MFGFEQKEREQICRFFEHLLALDTEYQFDHALVDPFSGSIPTLVDSRFAFEPFWLAIREHDSSWVWGASFAAAKKRTPDAVMRNDTVTLLPIVRDRLYVLRNQLIHGGVMWAGRTNRAQVEDGTAILEVPMPVMSD